jgi:hypothetical protein
MYEVRPRKDRRGVDLISDALPFGRLWYAGPDAVANAIGYAEHRSRSHDAAIRVYDDAGNVLETREVLVFIFYIAVHAMRLLYTVIAYVKNKFLRRHFSV